MAGTIGRPINSLFDPKPVPPPATALFGNPSSFTAAADTQAKDYDKIMGMYGDLASSYGTNPLKYTPVAPKTTDYSRSSEVSGSLANLSDLSQTGGYTDQGIADLRARGISPIRSIYSSAQEGLDRSKSLAGGYSPNYAATTAKMAREMSDKIGQATQDVNAGIAQNVAANKLQIAPQYASAAERENETRTGVDLSNADAVNKLGLANATNLMDAQKTNRGGLSDALSGMRTLYGTTPALTKTFGDQVVQGTGIGQDQQKIDEQRRKDNFTAINTLRGDNR